MNADGRTGAEPEVPTRGRPRSRVAAGYRVTGASVVALEDSAGPFFQPRGRAFPDATGDLWAQADALDPDAVDVDGAWHLRFRCFAVRLDAGPTVLVDTGVGPAGSPATTWAPVPGRLPEVLAGAGIEPVAVDAVVLTHLHADHVGWAVTGGRPFFPNARYVVQRTEVAAVSAVSPAVREQVVEPLRSAGRLDTVDGEQLIAGPVRVVPTPGHTPGHQSVLVDTGDHLVALTGDLLVHALQLVDPGQRYAHESDPDTARRSRRGLLADVRARAGVLATPHLGAPYLVATAAGWRPAGGTP